MAEEQTTTPTEGGAAGAGDGTPGEVMQLSTPVGDDAGTGTEGAKPAEDSKGDGTDTDKGDGTKDSGAPDEYTDFQMPEGMEVDKEALDQFTPMAKELGLTQESAQSLVSWYAAQQAADAQSDISAWEETQAEWVAESKADPDFGGAKYDASVGHAKAFLKQFDVTGLQEALSQTGAGNHPAFFRMLAKAGAAVAEGTITSGVAQGKGDRSQADRIFPDHKP